MKISLTIEFAFVFMMCATLIKGSATQAASKACLVVALYMYYIISAFCYIFW